MNRWVTAVSVYTGKAGMIIAAGAIVVLMLHTIAGALMRSFSNQPIEGTIEYVGNWYMPLIVLLAFVATQQKGQHIEARLLFDRAPERVRFEFQMFSYFVTFLVALGLAWYGYVEAVRNMEIGLTAGVIGVTVWPATFAVPIGFLLFAFQIGVDAAQLLVSRISGGTVRQESEDGVPQ
ncbi:TRAP transporter small permease [Nocardiopsis oceani]